MIVGTDLDGKTIHTGPEAFERHMLIIGRSGGGKTTLLKNLYSAALRERWGGLLFIDPHGDAANELLEITPASRVDQVILFDPLNQREQPLGLNLFALPDSQMLDVSCDLAVNNLRKTLTTKDIGWGIHSDDMANALYRTLAPQGGTIYEIEKVLTSRAYRMRFYPYLAQRDPITHSYWVNEYDGLGRVNFDGLTKEQEAVAGPLLRRLRKYLANSMVRNIIGQRETSLNLSQILEESQILIVRLPTAELGEDVAGFFGRQLIAELRIAMLKRSQIPPEERKKKPFYAIIDEFQTFVAQEDLPSFFSGARKFSVHLIVAHQHRSQLRDEIIKDATLDVGSLVAFQTLAKDAQEIERELGKNFTEVLPTLDPYHAVVRLDQNPNGVQVIKTLPDYVRDNAEVAEKIRRRSLALGRPREEVEAELLETKRRQYRVVEEVEEVKYELDWPPKKPP